MVEFIKMDESDISWKVHNDIHLLLNKTYVNSKQFVDKTHAHQRPSFRVLAYTDKNELVGHHAGFFPITTTIDDCKFQLMGLGLYAVLPDMGLNKTAINIYEETLRESYNLGYTFAVALSSNEVVLKLSERHLNARIIDIPIRAKGGYSKRSDKLIVVSTLPEKQLDKKTLVFIEALKDKNELTINEDLF